MISPIAHALATNHRDLYRDSAMFHAAIDQLAELLPLWIDGIAAQADTLDRKRQLAAEMLALGGMSSTASGAMSADQIRVALGPYLPADVHPVATPIRARTADGVTVETITHAGVMWIAPVGTDPEGPGWVEVVDRGGLDARLAHQQDRTHSGG